jgi:hypothetical protein
VFAATRPWEDWGFIKEIPTEEGGMIAETVLTGKAE